ncbi:MAG: CHAT domain-containing protein [Nitrospirae bacterium]|nr:MAG: CHAT domain-containing protein [Nitrospirota bacterium]
MLLPTRPPHRDSGTWKALAFLTLVSLVGWSSVLLGTPLLVEAENGPVVSGDVQIKQGFEHFQYGQFKEAATVWAEAAWRYEATQRVSEQAYALVYLARALYQLGQYDDANASLRQAWGLAKQQGDRRFLAILLEQAGNVSLAAGQVDQAVRSLQEGLSFAREEDDPTLVAALLNDLGNALASQGKNDEALGAYIEAAILAEAMGDDTLATRSHINTAMASIREHRYEEGKERLDFAVKRMRYLPSTHEHASSWLNIGLAYVELLRSSSDRHSDVMAPAAQAFRSAAAMAKAIGDARAESYGWGFLGNLYERAHQHREALRLTARAILVAQRITMPEALYRWEWQQGRIYRALQRFPEAIHAYQRAVDTVQPMRRELTVATSDGRLSFRESVGPLFFEFAELLLQRTEAVPSERERQALLRQARQTIEGFKAAELQDYFRDDCVEAVRSRIATLDTVSDATAVLYPIIFPDRIEMLASLGARIVRVTISIDQVQLIARTNQFRRFLEKRTTRQYLPHAQSLYDLLIRPLDHYFRAHGIDTLVIVPDGVLRTIPFGALHDGKQFLVEMYAMAVTPGLTLTDPQPIDRQRIHLLTVGLTEGVQGFPPLPFVNQEVSALQRLYGGQLLLNRQFLVSNLERTLKNEQFTIVHVASHGQFEPEVTNSFILAFDDRLTMDKLDELIGLFQFRETPLDLLALSACETAVGDDRAALGLAGLAIKAGARSALATLWLVNDRAASALINEFYVQLRQPSLSKAMALQRAQQKLIAHPTYQHPGYWSPFLLINNWL